jgi:hypothetical protein
MAIEFHAVAGADFLPRAGGAIIDQDAALFHPFLDLAARGKPGTGKDFLQAFGFDATVLARAAARLARRGGSCDSCGGSIGCIGRGGIPPVFATARDAALCAAGIFTRRA